MTDGGSQNDRGRAAILRAARQLFATSGFHQAPMSELASVAQVSVGQIYRLFAGKSDVIAAIVEEDMAIEFDRLQRVCDAAESGSISQRQAIRGLIEEAANSDGEALSFEILAEAHRNPQVADIIADACQRLRALLRRLASAINPGLAADRLEAAAELLLACLFGIGHRSLSRPTLGSAQAADQIGGMILAMLRAPADG